MKTLTSLITVLTALAVCTWCGITYTSKKVHEATGELPRFAKVDVSQPDRFLNNLMLSPFWKVEKERDGSFIAKARSIWASDCGGSFLFEFMAEQNRSLPSDVQIHNSYLRGRNTFSSFRITVVFSQPDLTRVVLGEPGQKVTIPVYESYESKMGPNSSSDLAIKLSTEHDVYVILHEQGADQDRQKTFAKVGPVMQEMSDLATLPENYRAEERYAAFFKTFFASPLSDKTIKRFPGNQDRDTFYGYFRVKPNTSYAGVNIRISHPVYCPDDGTRKSSRLQKAEYLGKPYKDGDIVFFLIEDNAVYLSEEYDQRFGTFTGKESFEGDLEVLNDKGKVLLKTKGQFKGWQK